jgi:hypothetical protein
LAERTYRVGSLMVHSCHVNEAPHDVPLTWFIYSPHDNWFKWPKKVTAVKGDTDTGTSIPHDGLVCGLDTLNVSKLLFMKVKERFLEARWKCLTLFGVHSSKEGGTKMEK